MKIRASQIAESHVTLWSKERCRWLNKVGDHGPLEVIYGGPHISMPSINHVKPGDDIYVAMSSDQRLYVVARMRVRKIVTPDAAIQRFATELSGLNMMSDDFFGLVKRTHAELGHRVPYKCVDAAALGVDGTEIRFDKFLPGESLSQLRLGPPGRERLLSGVRRTALSNALSLQGHVRRLARTSAELLSKVLAGHACTPASL